MIVSVLHLFNDSMVIFVDLPLNESINSGVISVNYPLDECINSKVMQNMLVEYQLNGYHW